MLHKKNIKLGKIKILFLTSIIIFFFKIYSFSEQINEDKFVELKILDKVSSKNSTFLIKIGQEKKFNNLMIKALMCKNSKFDDNPEVTAYIQVKDLNIKRKDKVFIFNDWTFASSPSLKPFDHPVYDIWLHKCIN